MSHFFTLVVIPRAPTDDMDMEDLVREVLAPFDENTQVPPYQRECGCIGEMAHVAARTAADEQVGTIASMRESFDPVQAALLAKYGATRAWDLTETQEEEMQALWVAHIAPYQAIQDTVFAAHPMAQRANPTCPDCDGKGAYESTYNPLSKWNWYQIGGRWDGAIYGKEEGAPQGMVRNMRSVADLLICDPITARALAAPEGVWLERGRMGWFGMSSGDLPLADWQDQLYAALAHAPQAYVVGCDLHI